MQLGNGGKLCGLYQQLDMLSMSFVLPHCMEYHVIKTLTRPKCETVLQPEQQIDWVPQEILFYLSFQLLSQKGGNGTDPTRPRGINPTNLEGLRIVNIWV